MTKKEMFAYIAEINAQNSDIVAFCEHEIELLNKKSEGSHKPTKNQIENEGYKESILDILAENDMPMTISEIMEDKRLEGLKNQRVSALITQLKKAGSVVRTEDKRKAYFSLAESEDIDK